MTSNLDMNLIIDQAINMYNFDTKFDPTAKMFWAQCACGHFKQIEIQDCYLELAGIKYYKAIVNGKCHQCEEMQAQEILVANEFGLPGLTGSEKQIIWANSIRFDFVFSMQGLLQHKPNLKKLLSHENSAIAKECEAILIQIDQALSQSESRYWIDLTQKHQIGSPKSFFSYLRFQAQGAL